METHKQKMDKYIKKHYNTGIMSNCETNGVEINLYGKSCENHDCFYCKNVLKYDDDKHRMSMDFQKSAFAEDTIKREQEHIKR